MQYCIFILKEDSLFSKAFLSKHLWIFSFNYCSIACLIHWCRIRINSCLILICVYKNWNIYKIWLFSLVAGGDLTLSLTDGSLATLEGIQLQLAANLVGQNVQISGIDPSSINNITLQVGLFYIILHKLLNKLYIDKYP